MIVTLEVKLTKIVQFLKYNVAVFAVLNVLGKILT